jgi:hypothetical protein
MKRLLILLALIPVLILAACSDFGLKGDDFNPIVDEEIIDAENTAVTFSGVVQVGGTSGTTATTSLTLTFSVDPTTLAASDITVTGATKGVLTGTGTTRSLAISAITVVDGATVSVAVASPSGFTVSSSPQTAVVYKAGALIALLAGQAASGNVDATGDLAKFGSNPKSGIAIDSAGNAYVCDTDNWSIRKVTPEGVVTTLVANSTYFSQHKSIVIDSIGNLFVTSYGNNRIIKVTPAGVPSFFAGSGTAAETDGTGVSAEFNKPWGLAIDSSDNLYVSTNLGNKIRKITPDAVVTTIAGSGGGNSINNTGILAQFSNPTGLVIDSTGNLFVWDSGYYGNKFRKITPLGVVTTFAGTGTAGFADGTGTAAIFNLGNTANFTIDSSDNIFVPDINNFCIRKITPAAVVTTYAGTRTLGYLEGALLSAQFNMPTGMAFNSSGACYIIDQSRIRKITQ